MVEELGFLREDPDSLCYRIAERVIRETLEYTSGDQVRSSTGTLHDFLQQQRTELDEILTIKYRTAEAIDIRNELLTRLANRSTAFLEDNQDPLHLEALKSAVQVAVNAALRNLGIANSRLSSIVTFDVLSLRRERVHPLRGVKYFVTGGTDLGVQDRGAVSDVTLVIQEDDFGWDSYLVIPYVLFHEFVAHLTQNPAIGYPSPNSHFAEGWMDYVAELLHAHTMDDKLMGSTFVYRKKHKWDGYNFHRDRQDPKKCYDSSYSPRSMGCFVAERLHELILELLENPQAEQSFLRLSFELNASTQGWRKLDLMTTRLHRSFRAGPELARRCLYRYINGGGPESFLAEALA